MTDQSQTHCQRGMQQPFINGLLILFTGMFFLLHSLGVLPWQAWHFLPIALILVGLRIMLGNMRGATTIVAICTIAFFCFVIIWGLVQTNAALVTHLPTALVTVAKSITFN